MSTAEVIDCRPADFDSLSPAEQAKYIQGDEIEEIATISGHIFVACEIEGFKGIAVATTPMEIEDTIRTLSNDKAHAKASIPLILKNIMKYKGKVDALFKKGGKKWTEFCQDVVLYYVARAVSFQKPIPIIPAPRDRIVPANASKWNSMDELPKCDTLPDGVGVVNENPRSRVPNPDLIPATIVEDDEE